MFEQYIVLCYRQKKCQSICLIYLIFYCVPHKFVFCPGLIIWQYSRILFLSSWFALQWIWSLAIKTYMYKFTTIFLHRYLLVWKITSSNCYSYKILLQVSSLPESLSYFGFYTFLIRLLSWHDILHWPNSIISTKAYFSKGPTYSIQISLSRSVSNGTHPILFEQ